MDYSINFSTYVDGVSPDTTLGWEQIRDIEVDAAGYIYVIGGTTATSGFPISEGRDYKTDQGGGLGRSPDTDVFVIKYSPTGEIVWATRLGGQGYDRGYALELDASGDVIVAGRAGSGLGTTAGVYQEEFAGDLKYHNVLYGEQDGWVGKLSGDDGSLTWLTYIGGIDGSFVRDIDLDANGVIHIAMTNASRNSGQPITSDAYDTTVSDNIYAQLSSDGTQLLYGTYVGGDGGGPSLRVEDNGDVNYLLSSSVDGLEVSSDAYQENVAGSSDLYVVKFDGATGGKTLKSATYLGGASNEGVETHSIDYLANGDFVVGGAVHGPGYPVTVGAYDTTYGGSSDSVLSIVSADGTTLLASTFVGGSGDDGMEGVVATDEYIYVILSTTSTDLEVTDGSLFSASSGGSDGYLAVFTTDLKTLAYGSYLGGIGADGIRGIAVMENGDVVIGGQTTSSDFPMVNAQDSVKDGRYAAFLTKLTMFQTLEGTDQSDYLVGTDKNERICGHGGNYDQISGGGGEDHFMFGDEITDGQRGRTIIMDYEVGVDAIYLEAGTSIVSARETSNAAVLKLSGDGDLIYVQGIDLHLHDISVYSGADLISLYSQAGLLIS